MRKFRKKRETRLFFRDKTLKLLSKGHLDEQKREITLNIGELGFLKKNREITLPISAFEFDPISFLTSDQIRVDIPNYYASGQEVAITDRKDVMLRQRIIQRERELMFAKMQLSSANQALESNSATSEDMLKKRIAEIGDLIGVVSPMIRPASKSRSTQQPTFIYPENFPQMPISEENR